MLCYVYFSFCVFFFKQKTAYEMRISDWSSDVCSSDLFGPRSTQSLRDGPGDAACTTGDNGTLTLQVELVHGDAPISKSGAATRSSRASRHYILHLEIGRASCRERVCQYVSISVVAVSLKKKNK